MWKVCAFQFMLMCVVIIVIIDGESACLEPQTCGWEPKFVTIKSKWAEEVTEKSASEIEYPRPQFRRDSQWKSMTGIWEFDSSIKNLKNPPFGLTLSERILVPFPIESPLSGLRKQPKHDRMWYRRVFSSQQKDGYLQCAKGEQLRLNFEAVDWEAKVYVNGFFLGTHRGGFDPFSFLVPLNITENGEDLEILIGVYDATENGNYPIGKQYKSMFDHPGDKYFGIVYTPTSGIWAPVWMECVSTRIFLNDNDVRVITKVSDVPTAHIDVKPTSSWSQRHQVKIEGPLDQGFWPSGLFAAPSDDALKFDLEAIQELGFNMVRKHIKTEPRRWYHYCNTMGLLVWQDIPSREIFFRDSEESIQQFRRETIRIIDTLKNNPSIVMWIPFNEGWGLPSRKFVESIANQIYEFDSTRLVNDASGGQCWSRYFKWFWGGCYGNTTDHHVYPAPSYNTIGMTSRIRNDTIRVVGEYGGIGLNIDNHMFAYDAKGNTLCRGYLEVQSRNQLTNIYVDYVSRLRDLFDSKGVVAGVYTQITDVECECNGLYTYDRLVKIDDKLRIKQANEALIRYMHQLIRGDEPEKLEFTKYQLNIFQKLGHFLVSYLL